MMDRQQKRADPAFFAYVRAVKTAAEEHEEREVEAIARRLGIDPSRPDWKNKAILKFGAGTRSRQGRPPEWNLGRHLLLLKELAIVTAKMRLESPMAILGRLSKNPHCCPLVKLISIEPVGGRLLKRAVSPEKLSEYVSKALKSRPVRRRLQGFHDDLVEGVHVPAGWSRRLTQQVAHEIASLLHE